MNRLSTVRTTPVLSTPAPTIEPSTYDSIEHLELGSVTCDFMRLETFSALCVQWLTEKREQRFHHVVTLNPEMVMTAQHDEDFREALQAAELRVPDGAGLIWAQWYVRSQFWSLIPSLVAFSFRQVERITGVDTVWLVARLCARYDLPLYLLGGTAQQVQRTAKLLTKRLPNLKVFTSTDHAYDIEGPVSVLKDIQDKQPAVLLVAYGAQKQSTWIERHRAHLPSVRLAIGVGGAFAILSEDTPRAPKPLRQLNLEWLWRLLLEPSRLPRIWRATVQFPLLIARQKAANPPTFSNTATKA